MAALGEAAPVILVEPVPKVRPVERPAPAPEMPALTDVDLEPQQEQMQALEDTAEKVQILHRPSSKIATAFLTGVDVKHAIIRSMEEQKVHTTLVVGFRAMQVILAFVSFICVSSSGVDFYDPFPSIT